MYVDYQDFIDRTLASDFPTEEQYVRLAPIVDSIIDDWTLGRVGTAVRDGEELPEPVVTLYVAIMEALPGAVEGGKANGQLVKSFSNGVDKFEFEDEGTVMDRIEQSCQWMLGLLPIEWCSTCVSFSGGNAYAS